MILDKLLKSFEHHLATVGSNNIVTAVYLEQLGDAYTNNLNNIEHVLLYYNQALNIYWQHNADDFLKMGLYRKIATICLQVNDVKYRKYAINQLINALFLVLKSMIKSVMKENIVRFNENIVAELLLSIASAVDLPEDGECSSLSKFFYGQASLWSQNPSKKINGIGRFKPSLWQSSNTNDTASLTEFDMLLSCQKINGIMVIINEFSNSTHWPDILNNLRYLQQLMPLAFNVWKRRNTYDVSLSEQRSHDENLIQMGINFLNCQSLPCNENISERNADFFKKMAAGYLHLDNNLAIKTAIRLYETAIVMWKTKNQANTHPVDAPITQSYPNIIASLGGETRPVILDDENTLSEAGIPMSFDENPVGEQSLVSLIDYASRVHVNSDIVKIEFASRDHAVQFGMLFLVENKWYQIIDNNNSSTVVINKTDYDQIILSQEQEMIDFEVFSQQNQI